MEKIVPPKRQNNGQLYEPPVRTMNTADYNDMELQDEEEEYEDEEMSQMQRTGYTRFSDNMMKTPVGSNFGQQQKDPRTYKEDLNGIIKQRPPMRDPLTHDQYFQDSQAQQMAPISQEGRPNDVKMPRMIEAHKAQSVMEKKPMGGENYDLNSIRTYKEPIPSFLPIDGKYNKYQNMLQHDEEDLKGRLVKQRCEQPEDPNEQYQGVRRKKAESGAPYSDPFKVHIQRMEEKLKYGEVRSASTVAVGQGVWDPNNQRNQGYNSVQRQRQAGAVPRETSNTLSLPQIKNQLDGMEDNMEREIDREVKMRKDAKKLIIDAVRKEPKLDRNVKAWLKTERENDEQLNDGQVFTRQYRKLIYQEVKKDQKGFPLMNQFINQGLVTENEEMDPLKKAKLKYKMQSAGREIVQKLDIRFDYEKVKKVYNSSLLDSELLDPLAYLLKKKQDAKTCIMHVFKRKYEEKMLHQKLSDPYTLKKDREIIGEKLKTIKMALELSRQRLEWVLFDTPFTIKQLEEEINDAKAGKSAEHENEKLILKRFLKTQTKFYHEIPILISTQQAPHSQLLRVLSSGPVIRSMPLRLKNFHH